VFVFFCTIILCGEIKIIRGRSVVKWFYWLFKDWCNRRWWAAGSVCEWWPCECKLCDEKDCCGWRTSPLLVHTINLGQLLQQLCNVQNCIVKLSQPHIHRASGPKFKVRDKNVKDCKLTLAISTSALSSKRPASAAHVHPAAKQPRLHIPPFHLMLSLTALTGDNIAQAAEYWEKKRMSSAIFHYFIHADLDQKMEAQ